MTGGEEESDRMLTRHGDVLGNIYIPIKRIPCL